MPVSCYRPFHLHSFIWFVCFVHETILASFIMFLYYLHCFVYFFSIFFAKISREFHLLSPGSTKGTIESLVIEGTVTQGGFYVPPRRPVTTFPRILSTACPKRRVTLFALPGVFVMRRVASGFSGFGGSLSFGAAATPPARSPGPGQRPQHHHPAVLPGTADLHGDGHVWPDGHLLSRTQSVATPPPPSSELASLRTCQPSPGEGEMSG